MIVYIGRREDEYYQVANTKQIQKIKKLQLSYSLSLQTVWALESVRNISCILSDIF